MADDPLVALALRLTDGGPIDWKTESETGSVEPSLLQQLKQIEAVVRAHETVDALSQDDVSPNPVGGPFWGHLEIIELIGSGSYGDVYRAQDTRLGRDVALKLLRTRNAIKSGSLVREGHLLGRVRHPNVVTVHGADCLNGQTGLWMELIEGATLEQELRRRGALQADEVAEIGAILCDALDAVHSAGLLHRDVKAQNVMRDRTGRLVLMDFGSGHDAQRFATSTLEGTPLYSAPEVLNGSAASVQSDIYSLGVLLWYLLTGSYPVNGRSVDEIKRAHARGWITKLQGQGPVSSVAALAVECLAIDPRKRPCIASELARRLRACGQQPASRRAIRTWAALGAFGAAVLLLATVPLHLSSKVERRAVGEPIWSFASGATPSGAPSADGHYLGCHSGTIPVGICDVATGTVQRVPITDRWNGVFNARPLISPDGRRVAYYGLVLEEVKIFDLATSISRSLRVDPSLFVKVIAWDAAGESLLVVLQPIAGGPGASVGLLDANTESLTRLKQFDATPDGLALSHDHRHLAFTQGGDLNVTNLVTGATLHIDGPSDVHGSLLWTPNDDGILFTTGRNFSELHLVRLTDGHPMGEIEALHPYGGPPLTLLGISAAGNVYYNAESFFHVRMPSATGHVVYTSTKTYPQPATLYLAPFDSATEKVGTPVDIARLTSRLGADWSPDSTSIAYARSDGAKTPTIVIRSASTGVERVIELPDDIDPPARRPFDSETPPWVGVVRWSPERKILAHASFNEYLVDTDDMSIRRVELPPIISRLDEPSLKREVFTELYMPASVEWASDGSSVFYVGNGSVRRVDVNKGLVAESRTLTEMSYRSWVHLSPGERVLVYDKPYDGKEGGQVDVAALDDSVPRPLLVSERPCRPVGWWNGEVFVACLNDSKLSQLYLVDLATGSQKDVHVSLPRIEHVRVRPDGRAIAIMAERTTSGTFVLKIPNK